MAIYRLLREASFNPEDVARMVASYESALVELSVDRNDPITALIAANIIELAREKLSSDDICRLVVEAMRARR